MALPGFRAIQLQLAATPPGFNDVYWAGTDSRIDTVLRALGWPDTPAFAGILGPYEFKDEFAAVGLRFNGPAPATPALLRDVPARQFARFFDFWA